MCCARQKRGESVALTMPWLGLKSDGRGRETGKILPFGPKETPRPVRYTGNKLNANNGIAPDNSQR
jgi:hypothetical protein